MEDNKVECTICKKQIVVDIGNKDKILVVQYALSDNPQNTPTFCEKCITEKNNFLPEIRLCYVCEKNKQNERFKYSVFFMKMNMTVETEICSQRCRNTHENMVKAENILF